MRRIAGCLLLCTGLYVQTSVHATETLDRAGGFHLLNAAEDDFQTGLHHGRLARQEILARLQAMTAALEASSELQKQVRANATALGSLLPGSKKEQLRGVAEGAGVSEQTLLDWHAYWMSTVGECSHAVYFGPSTVGGRLHQAIVFHGEKIFRPSLLIQRSSQVPCMTVHAPGIVLSTGGVNHASVCLSFRFDAAPDAATFITAATTVETVLGEQTALAPCVSRLAKLDNVAVLVSDGKLPDARLIRRENDGQPQIQGTDVGRLGDDDMAPSSAPIGVLEIARNLSANDATTIVFSATELEIVANGPGANLQRLQLTRQGASSQWRMVKNKIEAAAVRVEMVQPSLRSADESLPDIYRLDSKPFRVETEPDSTMAGVTRTLVRFPSPVVTEHPENNTVHGELFQPVGPGPFPCVIVLHIAGGDFELSRFVARMLTRGNTAALFIKMPYYGERRPKQGRIRMISGDLERGLNSMRQVVLDLRRACDWIEHAPDLDEERIGITGISLGSIAGSLAAAIEPRITHACLIMGGAQLQHVLYESSEREAKEYREMWAAAGGDRESFAKVFAPYDPATYADRLRQRVVFMISASEDQVIPKRSSLALWEAAGRQRIVWYPCGHYTMAKYLLPAMAHTVQFFQEWPSRSLAAQR